MDYGLTLFFVFVFFFFKFFLKSDCFHWSIEKTNYYILYCYFVTAKV